MRTSNGIGNRRSKPCGSSSTKGDIRQPGVHQIDRILDRAVPCPVEDAVRFRPVAVARSHRRSDPVLERATSLRCKAEADVGDETAFVIKRLDAHELVDLAPLIVA
jgi:hypothetical protein